MVPTNINLITEVIETQEPSKTFYIKNDRIVGHIDGLDAIKQAIYLRLSTEKFANIIYSWDYGIQTYDLYGRDAVYAYSELKRRIEEALLQDDRINSVDNFSISKNKENVLLSFTANTIFGDADIEEVATINV